MDVQHGKFAISSLNVALLALILVQTELYYIAHHEKNIICVLLSNFYDILNFKRELATKMGLNVNLTIKTNMNIEELIFLCLIYYT